jgi:hypothetical protein
MEKPEERTTFKHPQLEAWIRKARPRLVTCALTILRAFFVAGCPKQGLTTYGSFEAWSDLIRQAMVWVGEADPCAGRKDLAAQTDETYEHLATLLAAWAECYPVRADGTGPDATLNLIKRDVYDYEAKNEQPPNKWDALRDALIQFDRRYDGKTLNTHRIGNALRTVEGRVIGDTRLKRHGLDRKVARWRLESVDM